MRLGIRGWGAVILIILSSRVEVDFSLAAHDGHGLGPGAAHRQQFRTRFLSALSSLASAKALALIEQGTVRKGG